MIFVEQIRNFCVDRIVNEFENRSDYMERLVLDKKKINNNKNWRKEWELELC